MKREGLFSEKLLSIEVELDELISLAGGVDGLKFLDKLSSLSKKDQEKVLKSCVAILKQFDPAVEAEEQTESLRSCAFGRTIFNSFQQTRLKVLAGGKGN